jgi:transposase
MKTWIWTVDLMRGTDDQTGSLFSYQSPESLVPADHPLRVIRGVVNAALERLSGEFSQLYSPFGRASIAPEKLLRALLVQAFFGVRSERQLMEQVRYNMLFRWFIGLSMDAAVWDVAVFTKNRDRLLEGDIARSFLLAVLADPKVTPLLSGEHFSVDGTMIEAWASMKSFQRKDGSGPPSEPGRNGERDFRGQKRSNETHGSVSDPDARLYRKSDGQPARLCYLGHVLMENRNGLIVDAELTLATGRAERTAAEAMIETVAPAGGVTLGRTKATTPRRMSPTCGPWASRRMWRRTRRTAARRSTAAPPAIPAMRSASVSARGSRSRSAG